MLGHCQFQDHVFDVFACQIIINIFCPNYKYGIAWLEPVDFVERDVLSVLAEAFDYFRDHDIYLDMLIGL